MYHLRAFKILQNHLNQSIQVAKQNYVNTIAQKRVIQILVVSSMDHS